MTSTRRSAPRRRPDPGQRADVYQLKPALDGAEQRARGDQIAQPRTITGEVRTQKAGEHVHHRRALVAVDQRVAARRRFSRALGRGGQ